MNAFLRTLKVLFTRGLTVLLLAATSYVGYQAYDYMQSAAKFSSDGACTEFAKRFKTLGRALKTFDCVNTHGSTPPSLDQEQAAILFLARPPSLESPTGHAWVVFVRAKIGANNQLRVCQFLPVGFGPPTMQTKWPPYIQAFYSANVARWLPRSIEKEVSYILGVTWLSLSKYPESNVRFDECRDVDQATLNSPHLKRLFGSDMQFGLVALVPDADYAKAREVVKSFGESHDYILYFRDCVAFVERVANAAGLYTPPRMLQPYPADYIDLLSRTNRK